MQNGVERLPAGRLQETLGADSGTLGTQNTAAVPVANTAPVSPTRTGMPRAASQKSPYVSPAPKQLLEAQARRADRVAAVSRGRTILT